MPTPSGRAVAAGVQAEGFSDAGQVTGHGCDTWLGGMHPETQITL